MPDHARLGLDIWGDDEWLDLPPDAQHLYFVLKTWPPSFCGAGEWHPARIATRAKGWTADNVCASGQTLIDGLFLLVDPGTEEYLLRSWIKHDGLFKVPNMAVSMANARAALASRLLRGVVVHEVRKLRASHPDLTSWSRDQVASMLSQKPIDPGSESWPAVCPNPTASPWVNPSVMGWVNPSDNPSVNGQPNPSVNPRATPSPAPLAPTPKGGYVSTEGHQADINGPNPPPPKCSRHPNPDHDEPCRTCRAVREYNKAHAAERDRALANRKHRARIDREAAIRACRLCDPDGQITIPGPFEDRQVTNCPHDAAEIERAKAGNLAIRAQAESR